MDSQISRRKPELRCRFCANVYQKREHLERHERIHTGDKPFACAKCHRLFSRHDSLIRHQRVHAARTNRNESRSAALPGEGTLSPPTVAQPRAYANIRDHTSGTSLSSPTTVTHALGGDPPYFAETEDFFQYLLSTPPGWPTSLPHHTSAGNQYIDPGGYPELSGQQTEQIYDGSPQAVQQAGAVIHDAVSDA